MMGGSRPFVCSSMKGDCLISSNPKKTKTPAPRKRRKNSLHLRVRPDETAKLKRVADIIAEEIGREPTQQDLIHEAIAFTYKHLWKQELGLGVKPLKMDGGGMVFGTRRSKRKLDE